MFVITFFLLLQSCRNNMQRRNTQTKAEILNVLEKEQAPLSHDMLAQKLEATIDRATIYRVLNRFYADGKVHKVVGDDGKQYFVYCAGCEHTQAEHSHNHFHFKCLGCGSVECLKKEFEVALPKGYRAENYNAFITGYCSKC